MSLVRWDPLREVSELQRSINDLFEGRYGDATAGFPVDVYETPAEVVVRADLPGVQPDSIKVEHHDGSLYIRATRGAEVPEGATWMMHQTAEGEMCRAFTLGVPVDVNAVRANYEAGILEVRLPKAEHARPRRIPVETGASSSNGRRRAHSNGMDGKGAEIPATVSGQ